MIGLEMANVGKTTKAWLRTVSKRVRSTLLGLTSRVRIPDKDRLDWANDVFACRAAIRRLMKSRVFFMKVITLFSLLLNSLRR